MKSVAAISESVSWARRNPERVAASNARYRERIAAAPKPGPDTIKKCTRCEAEKPRAEFYPYNRAPDGRAPICRECDLALQRFKKYGLTAEQKAAILEKQGGVCGICSGSLGKSVVDHNHDTGAVRGLLCQPCNLAIGHLKDDPKLCEAAARYLVEASQ